MDDNICTPFKRTEKIGCRERVIDHQRNAKLVGDIYHLFKWKNINTGISKSFTVHQFGVRFYSSSKILRVFGINKGDFDP